MPRKSSIKSLPEDVLARLNFLLAEDAMTLDELVAWLDGRGHPRSRSALGRHKKNVERAAARLRQSREMTAALARELPEAAMQGQQGRMIVEMARSLLFDMLMQMDDDALDPKSAAFIGKAAVELSRALRLDQDFETKIREQAAREEREKAAKAAGAAAIEAGLSDEAADLIRRRILGVRDAKPGAA